ncbi:glycosyltransferase family 50 protein [Babjeviella inositovora NRRL Y-12698]|uniref:GPI mannosyltransferase 1 n=1 Tax=Babjeviella inositovora NRRL Y-12698 TaxID=984486 RepID=A0A1E3QS83_9ASCO|nr:glycosyltransferase family 50 protein [Babjeviella inositovora NRRL Y-12698]ODQ80563.1 glycosyltransferase family 50 protein [Babjeviella inositovora NRRL Y-12698]
MPRSSVALADVSTTVLQKLLNTKCLLVASILLRIGFFAFGLYQDATMEVKYTDIDYLVFSDAAKYIHQGLSPYLRETYRYTPLLAWMLVPNVSLFRSWGKIIFILCDLVTGILILMVLKLYGNIPERKRIILASIWLLNPVVITISTRGSSESVLSVLVMLFVYYLLKGDVVLSGIFVGISVHFKIYPLIYIPSALLVFHKAPAWYNHPLLNLINTDRVKFTLASAASFLGLTGLMYHIYGYDFLYSSYLYHLVRIDHRHNFSVFNTLLYFNSAIVQHTTSILSIEKLAFIPQLFVSGVLIPLIFAQDDFVSCLFLQTFAFVTFNKVITSQYFIWFLIFLPVFLRNSQLLSTSRIKGIACLLLWVVGQMLWLYNAYNLEFLGQSTFYPGLMFSSAFFFLVNIWMLGIFADDLCVTTQGSLGMKGK